MPQTKKSQFAAEIDAAQANPSITKLYANGFACALGVGDVVVLLKNGNQPILSLNMSFTIAKTLAIKLQDLIGFLEAKSGQTIMTSDDVTKLVISKETIEDGTVQ